MEENNKKPNGYWTYNRCLEQAKKYEYKKEFYKNSKSAYDIAYRKGWLKDYTWLKEKQKPKKYWDYDTCKAEAKKYETRMEFKNNCSSAYSIASRKGWLKDYDGFVDGNKIRWDRDKKWTYDRCLEQAKKYTSRGEFANECNSAYQVALRNGWLDDYDWMIRLPNAIIGGDSVYAYFFHQQHAVYVGRTINLKERHNTHCNPNKKSSVSKFAIEHNIEIPQMTILESGLSLKEGLLREDYYVNKYKEEGWTIINKAKTGVVCGSIGGIKLNRKWHNSVRQLEGIPPMPLEDVA